MRAELTRAGRTMPSFLGIGVEKCGTSWLHALLASHPDVYLPAKTTEVHYFDQYYERGADWYAGFFPATAQSGRYRAIGEITPSYLSEPACASRIAALGTVRKLVAIVRNPIDRAYSHYWHRVRIDRIEASFEQFLDSEPKALEWGFYSRGLARYLDHYERDDLLVLVFEESVADVPRTQLKLAQFLDVDEKSFAEEAGQAVENRGFLPRFPALYKRVVYAARFLHRHDQFWLTTLGKRLGIKRLFTRDRTLPAMEAATRAGLAELYAPELERLEKQLTRDFELWR